MNSSVSIITPSLNASDTISCCIKSVESQNYAAYEHIIIDGGSTDGTTEYLSGLSATQSGLKVISEPDNGMYDAMNKGIDLATGDIIGILNADDYYASDKVLEAVANVFNNSEIHACYGDLAYFNRKNMEKVVRYWKAGNICASSFYNGWMPPHPTFFVRREIYKKYGGYRLDMGTSADYELMLRLILKQKIQCSYIPETLVNMRAGGAGSFSLRKRLAANRMDRLAWKVNEMKPHPWTICLKPIRKLGQWIQREKH